MTRAPPPTRMASPVLSLVLDLWPGTRRVAVQRFRLQFFTTHLASIYSTSRLPPFPFLRILPILLQIRQARREKQLPRPRALRRPHRNQTPQQDHRNAKHLAQHLEEARRHLQPDLDRARREHAQRERETPPAHVEGEGPRLPDRHQRDEEPHQSESPHDQRYQEAKHVRDGACGGVERVGLRENVPGDFAKVHDAGWNVSIGAVQWWDVCHERLGEYLSTKRDANLPKASETQRAQRQEAAHDDLTRGHLVHRQPLEIHGDYDKGHRCAHGP